MARRRKVDELLDSEVECYYCSEVIPAKSMKCPSCGKMFSSAKKMIAFAVVLIVIAAALSFFVVNQFFFVLPALLNEILVEFKLLNS